MLYIASRIAMNNRMLTIMLSCQIHWVDKKHNYDGSVQKNNTINRFIEKYQSECKTTDNVVLLVSPTDSIFSLHYCTICFP